MLKYIVIAFVVILLSVLLVTLYYRSEVQEEKINHIRDQLQLTLDVQLKNYKMEDLRIALLLSKNQALVDALINDDEDLGYKILYDTVEVVRKNTGKQIRAQVITKDLNIFARSWDDVYAGMPIGDYRTDLQYFQTHTTPRTSIEVGRRLGVKATVPLYKNNRLVGFVESISFFKKLTDFFSSIGVDLYVLLDVKSADPAILMMGNLTIGDYILSNRNYNYSHIQTLKTLNMKSLKLNGVLYKDNKYIFYEQMRDGDGKVIGGFIFVLPKRYLGYFRNLDDDISFLINVTKSNLYKIVREEHLNGKGLYHQFYGTDLMQLEDVVDREDREVFMDEAYEQYSKYSKDELIQIILNRRIIKKIDGKIK
ncbi:MAG: hypothetical protein FAF05_07245 [Epsilonproteobacteria bacterium]|nr:hypothetical protein [Campylobacterota bacterium]